MESLTGFGGEHSEIQDPPDQYGAPAGHLAQTPGLVLLSGM